MFKPDTHAATTSVKRDMLAWKDTEHSAVGVGVATDPKDDAPDAKHSEEQCASNTSEAKRVA